MSNRAKLLVSVLFIAVIILCIGLTRFYFDVTKNTGTIGTENQVDHIIRSVGGKRIFRSPSGFCGVLDENNAVIIEPEWMEIQDLTDRLVIVSKRINDTVLIGGIDYEENVVLPFVYRSITSIGEHYKVGIVAEDETCIIYNNDYRPALFRSYDTVSYENDMLVLGVGEDQFSYYVGNDVPALRDAKLSCSIGDKTLNWRVGNATYLKDLKEIDLRRMNTCVESYMDMLIRNDFTDLVQISSGDYLTPLTKPGSFTDLKISKAGGFSLNRAEMGSDVYVFSFVLNCEPADPASETPAQTVQVQLSFRRNAENSMILTSAGLDYQSAEKPAPTEAE